MFKITTPTGRIVWGHPCISEDKVNMRTKQKMLDQSGKPIQQYAFGLAIPKKIFMEQICQPANMSLWQLMNQIASAIHGQNIPGDFAWKVKDGDGMDGKGKPYSARDGYAGCYVLTISTEAFCPPLYKWNGTKNDFDRLEPNQIKCGDHVAVALILKHNGQTAGNGAGIYVNPEGIELIAYDKEIVGSGANPQELFGSVNRAIPQGASAVPVSSAPAGAGMPIQQQPVQQGGFQQPAANNGFVQQQPVQQQPQQNFVQQQPVQQGGYPTPAHDFVNNAVQQQPVQQGGFQQPAANNGYPQNNGQQSGGFPGQTGPR